ncbi:MAG: toll/interleukin-1 receptor domain-containing protein [Planctomycetes bacterium]|nr:toll/interleukin-1 receptor domain-containing protein [Planctomycetota bacterium]
MKLTAEARADCKSRRRLHCTFVSHALEDLESARRVAEAARSVPGSRVDLAATERPTGHDAVPAVDVTIRDDDLVLLVWSPRAARRIRVERELSRALEHGVTVLPLLLPGSPPLPAWLPEVRPIRIGSDPEDALRRIRDTVDERVRHKQALRRERTTDSILILALIGCCVSLLLR